MFSDQYCSIRNECKRKIYQNNSHFLQSIIQQDKFETIENSRHKLHKESAEICSELRQCKLNDLWEGKRRERLLSESHELRQLKTQLQSALALKQLRDQQNYLDQQRKEEVLRKREENLKFTAECSKVKEDLLREEQEMKRKKEVYRGVLKDQVNEHRQRRRLEFEDTIKDREEMEKHIKSMQKDKAKEFSNTKILQERCKIEMEEYSRNRELRKQLEKEKEVHDNERCLAYQKKCDEHKEKIIAEKIFLQKQKEAFSEQIGQQLSSLNNEKQKRANMLLALLHEERKAKEDKLYRQKLENQIERRQQLRIDQEAQINEIRTQKEKKLKEEEEKLRQEHLLYLTERDKLDQLSNESRRRKKLEHYKALREMIELRRIERAKEVVERINEFEKLMAGEKEREKLIEKERICILSTVPKELLKYLPPGVLKSSDKQFLTLLGQEM